MSGAAQKYSSMTSKDLGSNWSKKVQMYIDAQAEVTGQQDRKKGFKNKAGTGTVPKAMKENYEADWPSMFAGLHGRPPANDAELDQWLDAEWEAYAAEKNPQLAQAKLNSMSDDEILKAAGEVDPLAADFHYWLLDRIALRNLGENDEAKPKWYEDAEWQYDLFQQYNGRPARDDDEIADWLFKMMEVQKSEGVINRGFRAWLENRLIMQRAMGEAAEQIVATLLEGQDYRYITCCVNSTAEAIHAMTDQAQDVTIQEFFRNVPLRELFDCGLAYSYDWTPKQCALAEVDYYDPEIQKSRHGLKWKDDWAISYHKSVYEGRPCYYFDHSRIEYIFVK